MSKRCVSESVRGSVDGGGGAAGSASKRVKLGNVSEDDSGSDQSSSASSWVPSEDECDDEDACSNRCSGDEGVKEAGVSCALYRTRSRGGVPPITAQLTDEMKAAMDKVDEVVDDESDLSSDTSSDESDEEEEETTDEEEDDEDEDEEEEDEYSDDDSFVTSDEEEDAAGECNARNDREVSACSELIAGGDVDQTRVDCVFDNDDENSSIRILGGAGSEDIPAILTRCYAGIDPETGCDGPAL